MTRKKVGPWQNFGDANPMTDGGRFIRQSGERRFEIVTIDPSDDHNDEWGDPTRWYVQSGEVNLDDHAYSDLEYIALQIGTTVENLNTYPDIAIANELALIFGHKIMDEDTVAWNYRMNYTQICKRYSIPNKRNWH